jgi:hypothetical protein
MRCIFGKRRAFAELRIDPARRQQMPALFVTNLQRIAAIVRG